MSWIRTAIVGAAFLGVASVAGAQGPQGGPGKEGHGEHGGPGMRRGGDQMLFEGITLTDAQQAEIQKIRDKYRAEREALRPKGGPEGGRPDGGQGGGRPQLDDATRAKMDAIRTKLQSEYRAILTPAQQAIFDKNVAEMKSHMEQRMKDHHPSS
jgi:Spy/CpxP family protein refolding chaperone